MAVSRLKIARTPTRQPKGRGSRAVYTALRQGILRLEFRPGSKLDEIKLVEKFGVSRTPVRESLIRLASEGLVFLLPNRGAQVAPLDLIETAQYFEALDLTQRAVNHLAAHRRTEGDLERIRRARDAYENGVEKKSPAMVIEANYELHAAIAGAARNVHLEGSLLRLLQHGMRLCWVWYTDFDDKLVRDDMARSCIEHRDIVAAIEAGDAQRADALGHTHNESFRQRMKDYLDTNLASTIRLQPRALT